MADEGGGGQVLVRLRCAGHPNIRASHDSTLELASAEDITTRATCVVGVRAQIVEGTPFQIAGPVTVTLDAGGARQSFAATANPLLDSGADGLVVRRSSARLDDTLATEAQIAASDLDRVIAETMRDPCSVLSVTVRRAPARHDGRPLIVVGAIGDLLGSVAGGSTRLAAELAAADAVVPETHRARKALRDVLGRFPALPGGDELARKLASCEGGRASLVAGERVLVVGADDLVGRTVPDLLDGVDQPCCEAFGMPTAVAAGAVLGGASPLAVLPPLRGRSDVERAASLVVAGVRIVTTCSSRRGQQILDELGDRADRAVVVVDPGARTEAISRHERDGLAHLWAASRGDQLVLAVAGRQLAGPPAVPVSIIDALIDRGVAPSVVAGALAEQPGWSRNRAYGAVGPRGSPARSQLVISPSLCLTSRSLGTASARALSAPAPRIAMVPSGSAASSA